jgi:hypothetical protein
MANRKVSNETAVVTLPQLMKGMVFLKGKNSSMAAP